MHNQQLIQWLHQKNSIKASLSRGVFRKRIKSDAATNSTRGAKYVKLKFFNPICDKIIDFRKLISEKNFLCLIPKGLISIDLREKFFAFDTKMFDIKVGKMLWPQTRFHSLRSLE